MREHLVTLGQVYIEADDPKIDCLYNLGPAKPVVVSNYGGWQVTARPKETGLTDWMGRDPLKVAFDIIFDRRFNGEGWMIERDIRLLQRMGGLFDEDETPPRLEFDSMGVIPHDNTIAPRKRWVIETLTEDPEWIERNSRGNRIRSRFDIVIMRYIEDERLARLSAAHRRRKRKKRRKSNDGKKRNSGKRRTRAKASQTLVDIAAETLDDPGRWPEIAELNGIRDPRSIVPGQLIKLP